jgi:hypothetical protein
LKKTKSSIGVLLGGFVLAVVYQLNTGNPNSAVCRTLPAFIEDQLDCKPLILVDLKWQRFATKPDHSAAREEFKRAGQYELIDVTDFSQRFDARYKVEGNVHHVTLGKESINWTENNQYFSDANFSLSDISLPSVPKMINGTLFFHGRILAEKLGLISKFKDGDVLIAKPPENFATVTVKLQSSINKDNQNLNLSYFNKAYETTDNIYLVVDHSNSIYVYSKPDYRPSEIKIPAKYGFVAEFFIDEAANTLTVGTLSGYLLTIDLASQAIDVVIGKGLETLTQVGETTALANISLHKATEVVPDLSNDRIFVLSEANAYRIDIGKKQITLIANKATFATSSIVEMDMNKGKLTFFTSEGKSRMIVIDPDTFEKAENESFLRLFKGRRIYGARYNEKHQRWIVLSSTDRNIVEAVLPLKEVDENKGYIIRSTFTGSSTAFLNGFGNISPKIAGHEDKHLIMDSDGFNIVRYTIGKGYSLISNNKLNNLSVNLLTPTTLATNKDDLFIMANLSHQVFKYSLANGIIEPYLGNGRADRNRLNHLPKEDIGIGYSAGMRLIDGKLWVADYFNRRIITTDPQGLSHELFPVAPLTKVLAIQSFDKFGDDIYFTDPAKGMVHRLRPGEIVPLSFAGTDIGKGDPEQQRRHEANSSWLDMDSTDKVRFGYPQDIIAVNDKLLVSDLYRGGVWELDPKTNGVRVITAMVNNTNYHFGGFEGNSGLSGKELRMASMQFMHYDAKRKLILMATGYGGSVMIMTDDYSKTLELVPDIKLESSTHALFLDDGRLAVVDSSKNIVHIFEVPDLEPLLLTRDESE